MATLSSASSFLKWVYNELDISSSSRDDLENINSIKSVEDILRKTRQLREQQLRGIRPLVQRNLFEFVCWYRCFEKENKREPNLKTEFNESIFNNFTKDPKKIEKMTRIMDFDHAAENSSNLQEGEALFQMYAEKEDIFYDIIALEDTRATLVSYIAEEVQGNLSEGLKEKCYFDIDKAVVTTIESLLGASSSTSEPSLPILIYGQTQSGKSAFKAVVIAVCSFMRIPLVCVTKDKTPSEELFDKQVKFAQGTFVEGTIFKPYGMKEADIQNHFNKGMGGSIIVPDNQTQLRMSERLMTRYMELRESEGRDVKFALIVDECDAMCRTVDSHQPTEKALKSLCDLGPMLHMLVSATPPPVMLLFKGEIKQELKMFAIGTSDDYVGVENMRPLRDEDGEKVYLDEKLSHSSENNLAFDINPTFDDEITKRLFDDDKEEMRFSSDAIEPTIPCTDEKVMLLYDTALATQRSGAKGILVLDCTLSRVNKEGNMFQKAARLQELFQSKGNGIIAVVYSGKGVSYRLPRKSLGFTCARKTKIGEVIEKIDDSADYGLDTPIFVFGYTMMRRVISYRSPLRVPTHIILYLGIGHSVENFVQALGRATFTGRSILEGNGHSSVTYLMPRNDAYVAPAYSLFVKEIHRRCTNGESLKEAMGASGRSGLLPDETNYLRHTNRKTGQRPKRDDIGNYHDRDAFEGPPEELSKTEKGRRDKYWNDLHAQRILLILCDDSNNAYSSDDIKEAYNDRYREDSNDQKLTKSKANKTLTSLKNDAVVRKMEGDKDSETPVWWEVEHPNRTLLLFINQDLTLNDKQRRKEDKKRRRQEGQAQQAHKQHRGPVASVAI